MLMNYYLVSVFSADQTGLIAAVTGALFEMDINLADTHYTILGEGGQFVAICETTQNSPAHEISEALKASPVLSAATIEVLPFGLSIEQSEQAQITHQIRMTGADDPGLVARVTEVIQDFEANVVQMNTRLSVQDGRRDYILALSLFVPESRQAACLAALQNIASSLGLSFVSSLDA